MTDHVDDRGPTLREQFDAMVAVLVEVRREMHRVVALEQGGQDSPALQRACMIAWPAIAAKWAALREAQATRSWSPSELALLIQWLHRDLVLIREVLAGRVTLSDPTTH
jgi:hypothetical protein